MRTIKLTESDLHKLISEAVSKVLVSEAIDIAKGVPEQVKKQYLKKMMSEYPNLDPDGFFWIGNNLKHSGKKKTKAIERPRIERKDGESNESFARRLSEVDPKFAEEHHKHEGEEFRPIENIMNRLMGGLVDYTDTYEVSNMGTFRVMDGVKGAGIYPRPYLDRHFDKEGEYQIHLPKIQDGCFTVKYIVAFAFPEIVKAPFNITDFQTFRKLTGQWKVIHKDGDKSNNSAENLQWVRRRD